MMNPRTKQNLMNAMKSDAFDAAKYSRFAARARMDSDWDLAEVFQEVSDIDRTEHFARIARMEGLDSSTPVNLRDAIEAETKEAAMFAQFACQAREDGDLDIAAVFDSMASDKAANCRRLKSIQEVLGLHSSPQVIGAATSR